MMNNDIKKRKLVFIWLKILFLIWRNTELYSISISPLITFFTNDLKLKFKLGTIQTDSSSSEKSTSSKIDSILSENSFSSSSSTANATLLKWKPLHNISRTKTTTKPNLLPQEA